jgi:uncharacterized protein (TIGR00269 family)
MEADRRFIERFERKVRETIEKYNLASQDDKILVACSGGKDSTTVLYLLQKFGYKVEALHINLQMGQWSKQHLANITQFCKQQAIKLHVIDMREEFGCSMCYIRTSIREKAAIKNCAICGVIRRWLLNRKAKQIKADKIATGHNLDDEVETILMNVLKGNLELSLGLGPRVGIVQDEKFVPRIKPLYFCTNQEVKRYAMLMRFPILYGPCPCLASLRREIREFLPALESVLPGMKVNLVKNFLNVIVPTARQSYREKYKERLTVNHCKICGEPCRNEICKTCNLIEILNS